MFAPEPGTFQTYARKLSNAEAEGYLNLDPRLVAAVSYVEAFNTGSTLLYHNTDHLKNVVKWCTRFAIMEQEFELGRQITVLLTAAIFHDLNHSGGKLVDKENIEVAIKGFRTFVKQYNPTAKDYAEYSSGMIAEIEDIIRVTEFPFVHRPKTPFQEIIRDADLMSAFEDDVQDLVLDRLRMEVSEKNPDMHYIDNFIPAQIKFMETTEYFTKSAKAITDELKSERIEWFKATLKYEQVRFR